MHSVFINRKPVQGAWGGGNLLVHAFYNLAPSLGIQIVDHPNKADVCFIVSIDPADGCPGAFQLLAHPKLLFRVNECDRRKNTQGLDEVIRKISSYSAHTVYVSNWLKNEISCGSLNKSVIYNGCDAHIFTPTDEKYSKLNNKINIVCHHWSQNFWKGLQYYKFLKEFVSINLKYTFTFIGRIELELTQAQANTIPNNSRHIQPLYGTVLGEELAKYDVCINGSFFDPAPNSCIESISCGIPTYVNEAGGGGKEFAGARHTFTTNDDIVDILSNPFTLNTYKPISWEQSIQQYVDLIKTL